MSGLEDAVRKSVSDLVAVRASFALIGGLAVSARTTPRFTRDLDFAVAVRDDAESEALVRALRDRGYEIVAQVEQEAVGRLAQVRLAPPGAPAEGAVLDLLFASSGIEREVVEGAESLEVVAGVRVPVASIGHLLALKVLSQDDRTRPQDRIDLRALAGAASPSDLVAAKEALSLVMQRGFGRERDLPALLERIVKDGAAGT
jgi:predicted nucleotidyltransferase